MRQLEDLSSFLPQFGPYASALINELFESSEEIELIGDAIIDDKQRDRITRHLTSENWGDEPYNMGCEEFEETGDIELLDGLAYDLGQHLDANEN